MINVDLKLLAVVNELYQTRSVSHAAENLQLSQAAISMVLAKLRRHFHDPLFVRTRAGMEPTPHATELVELLKQAGDLLQTALQHRVVFDPLTSDRMFRICTSDIGQVRFLPPLMQLLKRIAPAVRVDLRNISRDTPRLLESGEADVAMGFMPPMGSGFCQQKLFHERFVCAASASHPRVSRELTLEQFQRESHVAVVVSGTGHSIVEKLLTAKGITRKIGLRVPNFLGVAPIIENTDFLVILPEQLGLLFSRTGKIRLHRLPFDAPPYVIRQHWHERFNHDPANKWLRGVIAELMAEKETGRNRDRRKPARFSEMAASARLLH
jgi:DNA-binding transcriptional LysR family regulator